MSGSPRAAPPAGGAPARPAAARILVKEVNWLGDLVMSLPALRAVRAAWPRAHLAVLVKRELAGFFDGARWVDETIPYAVGRGWRGVSDRRAIVAALRARRFDLAILFPNSFESALWPKLAGIPRRVGFARDARGLLLTGRATADARLRDAHQVHYYLELLRRTLGVAGDPGAFQLDVAPAHAGAMRAWLGARRRRPDRPLIALAAGAAYGPAKQWPVENFAALCDLLAERHGAEAVLAGAPGERGVSEAAARLSRAGALVAAGETTVGQAVALLSLCQGFAGNDSGAMHVAGALGLPTVGLFGSTRPDRTGPLGPRTRTLRVARPCSPCLQRTCRYGHYRCLRDIAPAQVLGALEALGAFG